MEINPADIRDVLALAAFGVAFGGLLAIAGIVALTDIRRELRSLRRLVRRASFFRPNGAGDTGGIDRYPTHPTSKEEQT